MYKRQVEISYLTKDEQYTLLDTMEYEDCTPSHVQAIKMRKLSEEKRLSEDAISSILSEQKPNQIEQFKIPKGRIDKYFSPGTPAKNMEETIKNIDEEIQGFLSRYESLNALELVEKRYDRFRRM